MRCASSAVSGGTPGPRGHALTKWPGRSCKGQAAHGFQEKVPGEAQHTQPRLCQGGAGSTGGAGVPGQGAAEGTRGVAPGRSELTEK